MFTIMKSKSKTDGKIKYQILAPEEVEGYKDVFRVFDIDDKGYLTIEDFGRMSTLLNSEANIVEICSQFDLNGDGKITIEELLTGLVRMSYSANTEPEITHAFRVLDKNNDGSLDKIELRQLMTSLGKQLSQKEVDELIMRFDTDNDGRLQFTEFVKMLEK